MSPTRALPLVALFLVAALGACGSPSDPIDAGGEPAATTTTLDPETPVSSTPGDDDGSQTKPHPRVVEPHPGQADLYPLRWQKIDVGEDDRTLAVHFTSGVEPCYVLDHVDVAYRTNEVEITLYEGHDPDDEDTACIEIAEFKVTKVHLEEPLGGRKLVDGAKHRD
jgi:hypothetical protein